MQKIIIYFIVAISSLLFAIDELVPIIYDALESRRVVVMYNIPPDSPSLQALRKKYENMNYRELAQWGHDEVEEAYY